MRKELNGIMNEEYRIGFVDKPEWEIIGQGISNYNKQQAGDDKGQSPCFVLQAPGQEVVGGEIGAAYRDWL